MKITLECYKCIVNQLTKTLTETMPDDETRDGLMRDFLRTLVERDAPTTPPDFARYFHRVMRGLTGVDDPFLTEKDRSTELALALLPELREELARRGNSLDNVLRLVIGGNIIDFGATPDFDLAAAGPMLRGMFDLPLDVASVRLLEGEMERARSIFYMLDNCGEAVFDRLLLERFADKVVIGVRGGAILNDISRRELMHSGLEKFRVVDTGDRMPGVSLRTCTPEFAAAMRGADLVISKGQGNYESLDEYDRPIFYLLRVKCPVVADRLGRPLGALEIRAHNINSEIAL